MFNLKVPQGQNPSPRYHSLRNAALKHSRAESEKQRKKSSLAEKFVSSVTR